jgi:hypothetical protein
VIRLDDLPRLGEQYDSAHKRNVELLDLCTETAGGAFKLVFVVPPFVVGRADLRLLRTCDNTLLTFHARHLGPHTFSEPCKHDNFILAEVLAAELLANAGARTYVAELRGLLDNKVIGFDEPDLTNMVEANVQKELLLEGFHRLFGAGAIGGLPFRTGLNDCRALFDAHFTRVALAGLIARIDQALAAWPNPTMQTLSKVERHQLLELAATCIHMASVLPHPRKNRIILPDDPS